MAYLTNFILFIFLFILSAFSFFPEQRLNLKLNLSTTESQWLDRAWGKLWLN